MHNKYTDFGNYTNAHGDCDEDELIYFFVFLNHLFLEIFFK